MVEVNVAVTLGLACERVLFGGAGIAETAWQGCSMCVNSRASEVLVLETLTRDFWGNSRETLVLETLTCDLSRKSRTKCSFWRL